MQPDHETANPSTVDTTAAGALEDYDTREDLNMPFKLKESREETNAHIEEFFRSEENRQFLMSELIEGTSKLKWDEPKNFVGPLINLLLDDKLKADRQWESNERWLNS